MKKKNRKKASVKKEKRLSLRLLLRDYQPEEMRMMPYEEILTLILYMKRLLERRLFHRVCGRKTRILGLLIMQYLIDVKLGYEKKGRKEPAWFRKEIPENGILIVDRPRILGIFPAKRAIWVRKGMYNMNRRKMIEEARNIRPIV